MKILLNANEMHYFHTNCHKTSDVVLNMEIIFTTKFHHTKFSTTGYSYNSSGKLLIFHISCSRRAFEYMTIETVMMIDKVIIYPHI